jgi:hypothetical protein
MHRTRQVLLRARHVLWAEFRIAASVKVSLP